MYKAFKLPYDFLNQKYTPEQTENWDRKVFQFCNPDMTANLQEDLTNAQKARVDRWYGPDSQSEKTHSPVFGNEDRIETPYEPPHEKITSSRMSPIDSHFNHVNTFLRNRGWGITDYANGKAVKHGAVKADGSPDTREHNIGKVLGELRADKSMTTLRSKPRYKLGENGSFEKDENGQKIIERPPQKMSVSQAFAADPLRGATKKKGKVIFTKNKYDVAGMSTDRGWNSCMNMGDGINRHYLKHDIEHGTVTAYHVDHQDDGIKNPIARINLKKHVGMVTGHVIYRPETSSYGTVTEGFKAHVAKWADHHYPMNPDEPAYKKEGALYNDDGKHLHLNPHAKNDIGKENTFSAVNDSIKADFRGMDEAADRMREKGIYDRDEDYDPYSKAHSIFRAITPEKGREDHAFHHLRKASEYADGKDHEDHNEAPHYAERGSEDFYHAQAAASHAMAKPLTNEQLATHTKQYNALAQEHKDSDFADTDLYNSFRHAHGKLLQELSHRARIKEHANDEHIKSAMEDSLHHFADNKGYHEAIQETDGDHPFGHDELPRLTKNPRLIHKLLNLDDSGTYGHYHPYQHQHNAGNFAHAGEHADEKLANHVASIAAEHGDEDEAHHNIAKPFAKGLNKNPIGEHLQHQLTSGLYLHGGESEHGELKPVSSKIDADEFTKGRDSHMRDFGTSDSAHNRMFDAIGQHTTFPSVKEKMRGRGDVPNHLKESKNRLKSLKDFRLLA